MAVTRARDGHAVGVNAIFTGRGRLMVNERAAWHLPNELAILIDHRDVIEVNVAQMRPSVHNTHAVGQNREISRHVGGYKCVTIGSADVAPLHDPDRLVILNNDQ